MRQVIEGFEDYTLYHYGQYESRFLDRMRGLADEEGAAVDRIRARSCNVLAAIYSHVYFPTCSNGLKDIATFLGASWSAADASGVQSIAWRLAWETSRTKRSSSSCCVTTGRTAWHSGGSRSSSVRLCRADSGEGTRRGICRGHPAGAGFRFGKTEFFCPELAQINKCAYSDYQRDKVYLRTSPALRKSLRRKQRAEKRRPKVNEEVECGRPEQCPECGGKQLYSKGRLCQQDRV